MFSKGFFKITHIFILLIVILISISCSDSDNLGPHQQDGLIVILKADDLGDTTANWNRFMKCLIDDSICAGIGVISKNVHKSSISEIKRLSNIKQLNGYPVIEFWNHGYDHINLKKNDQITEFFNTGFDYQYKHFQLAQSFFKDSLQITSHAFGTPHNRCDSKTDSIVSKFPEINVWQLYSKLERYNTKVWKDPKYQVIKSSDHHIVLSVDYLSLKYLNVLGFEKSFSVDQKKPYLLIQIHPAIWNEAMFENFKNLVRFYKVRHKARFMTPYQYYNYLHYK